VVDRGEYNVERLRAGHEALAEGGVEALLEYVDPEFEVATPPELVAEPDTYRGHDGLRRYFASFYEAMDEIRFEPHEFISVSEGLIVVPVTLRARGKQTGIEVEQDSFGVWELRDGRAIGLEIFATMDEAMAAARGSADAAD
jgi:ketosteroid isomerase-like protein